MFLQRRYPLFQDRFRMSKSSRLKKKRSKMAADAAQRSTGIPAPEDTESHEEAAAVSGDTADDIVTVYAPGPEPEEQTSSAPESKPGRKTAARKTDKSGKAFPGFVSMLLTFLSFAVSIVLWELFLYRQIHASFSGFTFWALVFVPAEAMFFTFLCGWFRKRVADRGISIIVLAAVWFFYVAQFVYFRIFGSMFSVAMAGMAGDAVGNFGWALKATVRESIKLIAITVIPLAAFVLFRLILKRPLHYKWAGHLISLLLVPALWFAAVAALPLGGTEEHSVYNAYHSHLIDTDTSSSKIGVFANSIVELSSMILKTAEIPVQNAESFNEEEIAEPVVQIDRSPNIIEEIDFQALSEIAPDSSTKELCDYLSTVIGSPKNEYTGMLRDYNLIYICAESFSTLALDPNVTPTLYRLANEGIILDNYYNSYKNTTTNGEYAFLTGLWPDVSRDAMFGTSVGSFANSSDNYMPYGLGNIFSEQLGVSARGYHNYVGSYYCRDESLPNLGFDCKFMGDGMWFSTYWPSSDLEMMEQSVDDYINDDQFCAYYMTFSGHGPYTDANVMYNWNIYDVWDLLGDRSLTYIGEGYLACNYELEKAMTYLLERLEEAGKLDNTLIVLAGDHYPYYVYEEDRNSLAGHVVDTEFEMYKSTCIMWVGGLDEPIHVTEPCCNIDILPTVLNLFGLRYDSRLLAGRDVFSNTVHCAALYNKNIITDSMTYNSSTGETVWFGDQDETDKYRENYQKYYMNMLNNRYSMSLRIEDTDFYRFVWENTVFVEPEPEPEPEPESEDQIAYMYEEDEDTDE